MNDLIIHPYYFRLPFSVFLFHLLLFFFAGNLNSLSSSKSWVFPKVCLLVLKLLNLALTFLKYGLFHHLACLILFLFHLFLFLLMILIFFISFNIFFKLFISSLNSSIIIYFFQGVKEKSIFGIFEKLTVCFDLVPKNLYLFVSDSAELYSIST